MSGVNRSALEAMLADRPDLSSSAFVIQVALARTLASELDRQAAESDGDGMNAALVGRYIEAVGGLTKRDDDDAADPIGDLLAKILDAPKTGATKQG